MVKEDFKPEDAQVIQIQVDITLMQSLDKALAVLRFYAKPSTQAKSGLRAQEALKWIQKRMAGGTNH